MSGPSYVFGPSSKTLKSFREKLPSVVREALPFAGIHLNPDQLSFDPEKMWCILDEFFLDTRKEALKMLAEDPIFKPKHALGKSIAESREQIFNQVVAFAKAPFYRFQDSYENPLRWLSIQELLYYHGCTVATKFGVNFGLFGGAISNLGSDVQRAKYADQIASLKMLGGFGLTELGHGSNARDLETIAEYDAASQEFVLTTPNESSQKMFIGNFACNANHAAVFAQLYVDGVHHGVHVFLVRIREDNGTLAEGVRILDCGIKAGLNGVDNGRLWLDAKRIPRDNLLNRFGGVNADGKYVSDIKSNSKRFTVMIGTLVGGRVGVSQGALNMSKMSLCIAIRYALSRRQFGDGANERLLMDYLSHQRRLFPLLAKTFALQFAVNHLKRLFVQPSQDQKELHILAAGLKPACTSLRSKVQSECREACGGMGFLSANRIGVMMNDADIDKTWEGDNTVLLQQVAASLLKSVRQKGVAGYLQLLLPKFDPNPLSASNLHDGEFFDHAMSFREARILRALVNKLQLFSHLSSFEAWNRCLDIALELAKANVDRHVIHLFSKAIEQCQDESLKPMLHALSALNALCTIQELMKLADNMGFFMTVKYFSPLKAKAIWNEINRLIGFIRPHIRHLVDSFGIPEGLIDAPIAGDWLKAYSYPNTPDDADVVLAKL